MQYTIDRLEEEIAVLQNENGESFSVPTALLAPLHAREGDIILLHWIQIKQKQKRKRFVPNYIIFLPEVQRAARKNNKNHLKGRCQKHLPFYVRFILIPVHQYTTDNTCLFQQSTTDDHHAL